MEIAIYFGSKKHVLPFKKSLFGSYKGVKGKFVVYRGLGSFFCNVVRNAAVISKKIDIKKNKTKKRVRFSITSSFLWRTLPGADGKNEPGQVMYNLSK
ncbi:hypothetical protein A3F66_00130 [candidate division TM6 bacterium RIFCSPHIGHO2_12_FULL_32_22]|nr:MAG: hypothetical protein A3F66_00130 [candidate division TM6 bacterium RIFCSPHIGHO2_12_FULL_32_22]